MRGGGYRRPGALSAPLRSLPTKGAVADHNATCWESLVTANMLLHRVWQLKVPLSIQRNGWRQLGEDATAIPPLLQPLHIMFHTLQNAGFSVQCSLYSVHPSSSLMECELVVEWNVQVHHGMAAHQVHHGTPGPGAPWCTMEWKSAVEPPRTDGCPSTIHDTPPAWSTVCSAQCTAVHSTLKSSVHTAHCRKVQRAHKISHRIKRRHPEHPRWKGGAA